MKILAISSSRAGNTAYLQNALPFIQEFLGPKPYPVAFIPFASVDTNYAAFFEKVADGLESLPYSIHLATPANAKTVIEDADVIMIGGGNTFKLLHDIYQLDIFSLIQNKIKNGTPYIGWSAGANLTGLSISTTNDMPIIEPQSFKSFGFLPFQINPHYCNIMPEGFNGETRDQRLTEFLMMNPGVPVVGLPEGTALQLIENKLKLAGQVAAIAFQLSANGDLIKKEISSSDDISYLLSSMA